MAKLVDLAMDRSKLDPLPLFDVSFMFGASKSASFRARILMSARAIAEVLAERQLAKVDLRPRYLESPETFRVNVGDLTDEGLAFAKVHYRRWLASSDRWKEPCTYDKYRFTLERQVQKFRDEQKGH